MFKQIKKLSALSILVLLTSILVILSSCRNNDGADSVYTSLTSSSKVNLDTDDKTGWKKAYKNHLMSYTPEMGFTTLGLADFNADEQPELIILDDSHGTLGGKYTVVSYQNGTAVEICQYGMSSSIAEVNNQLYFYRSFDSIHSSGGTYGYGFVSRLDNTNGIFSVSNLLESHIDYNYNNMLEELSWKLEGEESVLKSSDFKKYLTIQEFADSKWQDISADKYISLKTTYIGADQSGKQITDYFKIKIDFFDNSDNKRSITKSELDEFFDKWDKLGSTTIMPTSTSDHLNTAKIIESPNLDEAGKTKDTTDVPQTDSKPASSIADKQKYLYLIFDEATRDKFNTVKVQGLQYNQFDTDGYYKMWDEQLNKIYGLLTAKLSGEDMKNLQAVQRQWIKKRDEKAEAVKEGIFDEASGKEAYTEALADATKRRTYELIDIYFQKEDENVDVLYSRAMKAYGAVLRNDTEIYDGDLGKYYLSQINDVFQAGLVPETQVADGFTILDMNDDDIPEIMVGLTFGGMRLVLHYEDGIVFGTTFGNRQVGDPKQDGTFGWSGSAFHNGYGKLSLYKDLYETVEVGSRDSDDLDNPYNIGDRKVTEKEYSTFSDEQNKKEDAVWYDFSKENIEKEVTNYLR